MRKWLESFITPLQVVIPLAITMLAIVVGITLGSWQGQRVPDYVIAILVNLLWVAGALSFVLFVVLYARELRKLANEEKREKEKQRHQDALKRISDFIAEGNVLFDRVSGGTLTPMTTEQVYDGIAKSETEDWERRMTAFFDTYDKRLTTIVIGASEWLMRTNSRTSPRDELKERINVRLQKLEKIVSLVALRCV